MKNVVFVASVLLLTMGSCKKDQKLVEEQAKSQYLQALSDCADAKVLPNLPKQDIYIEGEIDGKYFSISKNEKLGIRNTLRNFLALGYQKEFAKKTEWQGNGFAVYPIDTTHQKEYDYYIQIGYQGFQGDSLAYLKYFDQFQKGKTFTYRKEATISELSEPQTVDFLIGLVGCSGDVSRGNSLTSNGIDQTNSYFRVADVKNYISPSGQIYKRDVTIEFDVTLGSSYTPLKRIKNGRLFFSY